jgi:probable blue pigment (indigoidine) exporter
LAAFLNVSVWMGCTTASMHWLKPGQAATLAYTMPIWACLLAWPVLGQRPTLRQFGAVLMGLPAVVILIGIDNVAFRSDETIGIALALSAAVLFAFSTVFGKRSPLPMAPIALTGWQVGLGSVPLLIAGLMFEDAHFTKLSPVAWGALAYTAIVSMGLCYLTWFIAVRRLSATGAAIGTLLTPVIGVIASSLALGDPLTPGQLISLALVAGGIMLSVRDGSASPR